MNTWHSCSDVRETSEEKYVFVSTQCKHDREHNLDEHLHSKLKGLVR